MLSIIEERQQKSEEEELMEVAPEKFNPEVMFKVNKHASNNPKEIRYTTYTKEQVQALVAASNAPYEPFLPVVPKTEYPTLSRELAQRFVKEHLEYKEAERLKKAAKKEWDSQKTTESEVKTVRKTKRSKSTKS